MVEPPKTRKAFLSYRSVDRERVRPVAEALIAAGIDAWWDVWEILAGDNFVLKINEGLEQCDCGVVFFSKASLAGAWHVEEITVLKNAAVTKKRRLIPVLLDEGIEVPAVLGVHSSLQSHQTQTLIDAIFERSHKPPLGNSSPRIHFCIHLRDLPDHRIGVSALLDDKPLIAEQSVAPGADFAFSYADFLNSRPFGARQESIQSNIAHREHELHKLGDAVGKVVFTGDVGRELAARLTALANGDFTELELVFESASARLLSIPFEAARLADGRIPALTTGVYVWRRPAGSHTTSQGPSPGPLKILVAVGAPDEGKTQNAVLDSERELQVILDAVEKARSLGNAYVRVLEVGSPDQIGVALRELSYHVLHLSGHGNQGVLELEDEDGNAVRTTAAQLAAKIRESGHPPPLVVLASCHGGRGDNESASFAQGLLQSGCARCSPCRPPCPTTTPPNWLAGFTKNWRAPKNRWPAAP